MGFISRLLKNIVTYRSHLQGTLWLGSPHVFVQNLYQCRSHQILCGLSFSLFLVQEGQPQHEASDARSLHMVSHCSCFLLSAFLYCLRGSAVAAAASKSAAWAMGACVHARPIPLEACIATKCNCLCFVHMECISLINRCGVAILRCQHGARVHCTTAQQD